MKIYPSNQAKFTPRSKHHRKADKKRGHDEQCNNPKKQLSRKKGTEKDKGEMVRGHLITESSQDP